MSRSHPARWPVPPRFMRAANRGILKNLRLPRRESPTFPPVRRFIFRFRTAEPYGRAPWRRTRSGLMCRNRAHRMPPVSRGGFPSAGAGLSGTLGRGRVFPRLGGEGKRLQVSRDRYRRYVFALFRVRRRMPADAHGRSTALSFYAVRGIRRLSLYGGRRGLAHGVPVITAVRETPVRGGNHAVSI